MEPTVTLLGPPGSGKGTQAARLRDRLGFATLATGDLLREARRAGTDLGRRAGEYMDRGDLVPDELIVAVVREAGAELDDKPILLDGFPRTVAQADALAGALQARGRELTAAVLIDVPDDLVVERISGRRQDREDDRPETVRDRLRIYHAQTEPLVAYYDERGLLRRVDGAGDADAVEAAVRAAIEAAAPEAPPRLAGRWPTSSPSRSIPPARCASSSAGAARSVRCVSARWRNPRHAPSQRSCSTAPRSRPPTAPGGAPSRAGSASCHSSGWPADLAADRPRRGPALGQQLRGDAVLLGLGRVGGVAAAAHRAPRLAVELVLAAVVAVGRDGARVAARLALCDALQRGGGSVSGAAELSVASCALAGAAVLTPSAASVCGPATPSAVSPWARWKRLTAARVFGP